MSPPTSNIYSSICLCGKKRKGLNLTNWNRHIISCSVAKLKTNKMCSDVTSFFPKKDEIKAMNSSTCKKGLYYFKIITYLYIFYHNSNVSLKYIK